MHKNKGRREEKENGVIMKSASSIHTHTRTNAHSPVVVVVFLQMLYALLKIFLYDDVLYYSVKWIHCMAD